MVFADLYYRNSLVLKRLSKSQKHLDIGGFSSGIYKKLHDIYNLHVESVNIKSHLILNNVPDFIADARNLPFLSISYDNVLLIDILEHIDKSHRIQVIKEALRISKFRVFILFPYYSAENDSLEKAIRDLFVKNNISLKDSLAEHQSFGLPNYAEIVNFLKVENLNFAQEFVTSREMFLNLFKEQFELKTDIERKTFVEGYSNVLFENDYYVTEKTSYRTLITINK
jgi:ubiquinone/menaquinone biosynthesis C-methylase UbiE